MNNYIFTHHGYTFKRIDKKTARRAYINGLTVIICPCKCHPFNEWGIAYQINKKSREHFTLDEMGVQNDFNNLISSYEYYNCQYNQIGKYAAFYIPIRTVDRFTEEASTPRTLGTVDEYDYSYMERATA